MVEKEFQLDSYIMEFTDVLDWKNLEGLMKYINYKDDQGAFEAASVLGDLEGSHQIQKHVRDTKNLSLNNMGDSITDIHWSNYLYHNFFKVVCIVLYLSPFKTKGKFVSNRYLSVSTIPGIIENLSSVLFIGGKNKQEYPGGVIIVNGYTIF